MTTTDTLHVPADSDPAHMSDVPDDAEVRVDGEVAMRMLACARWQQ